MRTALVVLACALLGCQGAESGPLGHEQDNTTRGIIGGTVDQGDPAVVQMQAKKGNIGWGCTATLIAKRLVLTAAHCTEGIDAQTTIQVMFAYSRATAQPNDYIDVVNWAADPKFMASNNIAAGHDAAVLVLAQDAPVAPVPINRKPLTTPMIGAPARVIGYGFTNGYSYTGAGVKRQLYTALQGLQQGVLTIGKAGQTTCQGDSGGPTLMTIDGAERVVGITSYGYPNCTSYGSATRVDLCTSFIDPYLKLHGGQGCQPDCVGRSCGDDGCGGSCGSCGAGQSCDSGQCVCAPDCAGRSCGDDGCGGTCGVCGAGQTCSQGVCLGTCVPSCAGRSCGDDGCGGTCGSCGAGQSCSAGQCVCAPSCAGRSCGDDGCGGTCGSCGAGQSCSAGQCVTSPTTACDTNGGWESEPNNGSTNADGLCKSGMIYGVLDYSGDGDWFSWTVPPQSTYKVTLASMGYSMQLHKLINGQVKLLNSSSSQITAKTPSGGTYYLRVYSTSGSYDLYTGYSVKRAISATP